MAKAPKADQADSSELKLSDTEAASVSEQVTYLPGEGDPVSVKWAGYIFHANKPRTVTNAELIAKAKANKHFHVGEFDPETHGVPADDTPAPKTPEQYRAHAADWIRRAQSVEELDTRWIGEEELRRDCGVGTDDHEYLSTLFGPKRAELRKLESPT